MLIPREIAEQIIDRTDWDQTEGLHGTPIRYDVLTSHIETALIRYGDERARAMNNQCAQTVRDAADKMRHLGGEDATTAAMIQMCVKLLDNAERAIRALD